MKTCLNCQTSNLNEAIYCKECGKKIKSKFRKFIEIIVAIYAIFWIFKALI